MRRRLGVALSEMSPAAVAGPDTTTAFHQHGEPCAMQCSARIQQRKHPGHRLDFQRQAGQGRAQNGPVHVGIFLRIFRSSARRPMAGSRAGVGGPRSEVGGRRPKVENWRQLVAKTPDRNRRANGPDRSRPERRFSLGERPGAGVLPVIGRSGASKTKACRSWSFGTRGVEESRSGRLPLLHLG